MLSIKNKKMAIKLIKLKYKQKNAKFKLKTNSVINEYSDWLLKFLLF